MGLQKDSVHPGGNACPGHGGDQCRPATGHPRGLIGLLQGVGYIQYHRGILPHGGDAPEIHDHALVPEHGSPIGDPNMVVIAVLDLLHGMFHAFRAHELSFFQIDHLLRPGGVPGSGIHAWSFSLSWTFGTACFMLSGLLSCPFFRLTAFLVRAAAMPRSVWRTKKAGICRTATYSAAMAASLIWWISLMVG